MSVNIIKNTLLHLKNTMPEIWDAPNTFTVGMISQAEIDAMVHEILIIIYDATHGFPNLTESQIYNLTYALIPQTQYDSFFHFTNTGIQHEADTWFSSWEIACIIALRTALSHAPHQARLTQGYL